MTTLHINLPDDVKARLEAQTAQGGLTSIEQYAQALLLASSKALRWTSHWSSSSQNAPWTLDPR